MEVLFNEKNNNSNNKRLMKLLSFQKIRSLGQGTYGKCYLVHHHQTEQLCVLKQIEITGMSQQETNQAMKQAKILQALDHPCIIKFMDAFQEDNFINIVMSFADGGDLNRKIKQAKGVYFHQESVLDWFTQICLAIKHVHDRKIIHRDLKCQNIFLTGDGHIQLGDFGIAKPLQLTLQKIKSIVGTPYYMSPEICQNKEYDTKSDIWSLGVILYQMCTLKPPFDASSLPVLALKITKGEYAPITGWSKQIKKLISELLQIDPKKRPNINQILKNPLLKDRIPKYLSQAVQAKEFSHTTLHLKNIFQDDKRKIGSQPKIAEPQTKVGSQAKILGFISPKQINSNPQSPKINNYFLKFENPKKGEKSEKSDRLDKKPKKELRKREASQPNLNQNKKIVRSNGSSHNLDKKCGSRKKGKPNYELCSQLESINEMRKEVAQMRGQLSFKEDNNKIISYPAITEEDEEESALKTLQSILLQKFSNNQLSKSYQIIEDHQGIIEAGNENFEGQELLSLYYGMLNQL